MDVEQKQSLQDPVCGMLVNEQKAAGHAYYEGAEYSFCCPRCQQQFEADPAKYVNPAVSLPVIDSGNLCMWLR